MTVLLNVSTVETQFLNRMDETLRLVDAAHTSQPLVVVQSSPAASIEREARGLAMVMIFAAYERALRSLTREIIEAANRVRVGVPRLQPPFRAIAAEPRALSLREVGRKKFHSTALPQLVRSLYQSQPPALLNTDFFPDDGSFMKRAQISTWCSFFDVGEAPRLLMRIWHNVDGVVSDRNAIAHGESSPGEIGRRRSEAEVRGLMTDWRDDWRDFIQHVGTLGSSRDFFRTP